MASLNVTDSSFQADVLDCDVPVVVDFWAEWCGPCQTISPVVEEIALALDGKVKVAKLNIDENPNTPTNYGIRGIPTLIVFKNGEQAAVKVGAASKNDIQTWIENNL